MNEQTKQVRLREQLEADLRLATRLLGVGDVVDRSRALAIARRVAGSGHTWQCGLQLGFGTCTCVVGEAHDVVRRNLRE